MSRFAKVFALIAILAIGFPSSSSLLAADPPAEAEKPAGEAKPAGEENAKAGGGGVHVGVEDDHAGEENAKAGGHGHGTHIGSKDDNSSLLEIKTDLAIYTFIVFILLVAVLWATAFGPITKALVAREERKQQELDDAKAQRKEAEALRGQYEGLLEAAEDKVRDIYAEATAKAEDHRTKRVAEAEEEAQHRLDQAVKEIERAKDQAINELFELENQRIVQATEHVLGRSLSDDDQHRLVNEALAHFSDGQAS